MADDKFEQTDPTQVLRYILERVQRGEWGIRNLSLQTNTNLESGFGFGYAVPFAMSRPEMNISFTVVAQQPVDLPRPERLSFEPYPDPELVTDEPLPPLQRGRVLDID